jgi:hypothetical protein
MTNDRRQDSALPTVGSAVADAADRKHDRCLTTKVPETFVTLFTISLTDSEKCIRTVMNLRRFWQREGHRALGESSTMDLPPGGPLAMATPKGR